MSGRPTIHIPLVLGLGATGIVMGLLAALVGMPQTVELSTWIAFYLVWILVTVRVAPPRPLINVLLASLLSGVFAASIQVALYGSYVRNNPWYANELPNKASSFAAVAFPFALAMAALWGLLVGCICTGLLRRRSR